MATEIHSYRVGDDVHKALRRLAEIHGSVDKALRHFLTAGGAFEPASVDSDGNSNHKQTVANVRPFKGPIPKPSEKR